MNKDLEIIKKNLDYFMLSRTDKYGRECAKNIINLAASRMAAEIERLTTADVLSDEAAIATTKYIEELEADVTRLKAELEKYKEKIHHLYDINSELAQANSDTNFQLNFFKAELEKRRKVVFCGECTRAFCTRITLALKCRVWGVQVSPNAFCSRGQRKSEASNANKTGE